MSRQWTRLRRQHSSRRGSMLAVAVVLMLGPGSTPAWSAPPPSGNVSDAPISARELLSGTAPQGLSRNQRFARSQDAGRAHQSFAGTLRLHGAPMRMLSDNPLGFTSNPVIEKDTTFFPDVSLSFFTRRDHLVPTTQGVIRNGTLPGTRSYWDVIVQPGRVWSEPRDGRWSRASFPFALVNSIENDTHTGIAVFLYKRHRVSHVRFQIVQQTAPWYVRDYFSAWGVTDAEYGRAGIGSLWPHKHAYARQLASRLPVKPWSALPDAVENDPLVQASISPPEEDREVYVAAVVHDGVLYRTACATAAGPFPYCDEMRHGVWSVTKSAMLNVALLRLAEKYGRGILHEPIAQYLAEARRPGWVDVTFLDMANMASGHGHGGDELDPDYSCWYETRAEDPKTAEALASPRTREPGSEFHYRDRDAYLLGVAEDAQLKSKEGAAASIWTILEREVYRPIGIFHAPSNSTVEPDGSRGHPLMAFGYYPTLDDLAKIALLYQNHGAWNGRQILHRGLVDTLLATTEPPPPERSPDPAYYLNWWISQIDAWWVASMSGFGANGVSLLPDELVTLQMANTPFTDWPPEWPISDPCEPAAARD